MSYLATLLFFLFILAFAGMKFIVANRREARRRVEAEVRAKERESKEKELRERLKSVKEKDGLAAAIRAVQEDPERAARVVKKMLREK